MYNCDLFVTSHRDTTKEFLSKGLNSKKSEAYKCLTCTTPAYGFRFTNSISA